jgi:hypothetical protein
MLNQELTFTNSACAAQRFINCFPDAGHVPSTALNLIMDYCAPDWRPNTADEVRHEIGRAAVTALLHRSRGAIVFIDAEDAAVVTDHMDELLEYAEQLYTSWGIDCDFCDYESRSCVMKEE